MTTTPTDSGDLIITVRVPVKATPDEVRAIADDFARVAIVELAKVPPRRIDTMQGDSTNGSAH